MSEDTSTSKDTSKSDKTSTDAVEAKDSSHEADVKPLAKAEAAAPTEKKPDNAVVVTPNVAADTVYLSSCVYKNMFARKSLTVHHVQRRLNDLGFRDAYSDKDGWYGELTAKAVREFQEINGHEPTGLMDAATFEDIFSGDPHVVVNLVD